VAYEALDSRDEAFRWLDRAVEDRADCIPYLNVDHVSIACGRIRGLSSPSRAQAAEPFR
jgi:hypothetical protein